MATHKIMINCGHGTQSNGSWDSGCVNGTMTEAKLMMPITQSAVKYCRMSGITVLSDSDSGNNKNIITGVAWANKQKVELFISIHCDYVKAPYGVYPLYYPTSTKGKKLATALNTYCRDGMKMKSRGIKARSDLYELSETTMPAVVLETSNIKDPMLKKPDAFGKCIAKAICSYLGVKFCEDEPPQPEITTCDYMVKVEAGKCIIRESYSSTAKKVRDCPAGIFTIVNECNGWGQLKSKEGWIYLPYTTKYVPPEPEPTTIDKFCAELIRIAPTIEQTMVYSNDDGEVHSWADALKYKKCNCAKYINFAMQNVGMLPIGTTFYWYHTGTLKPAKGKTYLTTLGRYKITYPNRVMSKSELRVGDIVGWHTSNSQHTTAICGRDDEGNFIWASAGSGDMARKQLVARRDNFTTHKIHCHIRYIGD